MRTTEKLKADPAIFLGNWTVQMLFELNENPASLPPLERIPRFPQGNPNERIALGELVEDMCHSADSERVGNGA